MATKSTKKRPAAKSTTQPSATKKQKTDPFELRKDPKPAPEVHVFGNGVVCDTEKRGFPTPDNLDPARLVIHAPGGVIALWARGVTLNWRFQERSLRHFQNPAAVKAEVKKLMADAILAWGDAAPSQFTDEASVWDFEIMMRREDDCDPTGCVLASAFFPDAGRHVLEIYPRMFTQDRQEQVETFAHEIGHIFGLRHFFAQTHEAIIPSEVFGTHSQFSIMNYGPNSRLTPEDRSDLRRLYQLAWSGQLTHINGTPIRFVRPYHTIATPNNMMGFNPFQTVGQPLPMAAYVCEP